MNTLRLGATLLLLGSLTLCMAEETTTDTDTGSQTQSQESTQTTESTQSDGSVDAQITAIGNAKTQEERVALMNEFKTTISVLSNEDRTVAIAQLRSSMSSDGTQTQDSMQTRERSREAQMQQAGAIQGQEMMNQYQTASQMMQQQAQGMMTGSMGSTMGGSMSTTLPTTNINIQQP